MLPDFSAEEMRFIRKKKKGPADWKKMDYLLNYLFTRPIGTVTKPNNRCILLSVKLAKLMKKEQQFCCLMALCEYIITDAFTDKKFVTKEYKQVINQFENEHQDYENTQKAIVKRFRYMRNNLLEKWVRLIRILRRIKKEEMTEEWEYVISYPIKSTKLHLDNLTKIFSALLMSTPLYLIQKDILALNFDDDIIAATSHRNWESLNEDERKCLTKTIRRLYKTADYSDDNINAAKQEAKTQYQIVFNMEKREKKETEKEKAAFLEIIKQEDEQNRQIAVNTIRKVKVLLDKEEQYAKQNIQLQPKTANDIIDKKIKQIYILLFAQFDTDTLTLNSLIKYYPRSEKSMKRHMYPIQPNQAKIFYSKEEARQYSQEIHNWQNQYEYKMCRLVAIDTKTLLAKQNKKDLMLSAIQKADETSIYVPQLARSGSKNYTLIQNEHVRHTLTTSCVHINDLLDFCSFKNFVVNLQPTSLSNKKDKNLNTYQTRDYLHKDQYLCKLQKGEWNIVTYKHTLTDEIALIQFVSADTLTETKWNSHACYSEMVKIGTIKTVATQENFVYHYQNKNNTSTEWGIYVWSNNIDTENPIINAIELRLITRLKKNSVKANEKHTFAKAQLLTYYDDNTIQEYVCIVNKDVQGILEIDKSQQCMYDGYKSSHNIKKELILLDGTYYIVAESPITNTKYYFPIQNP